MKNNIIHLLNSAIRSFGRPARVSVGIIKGHDVTHPHWKPWFSLMITGLDFNAVRFHSVPYSCCSEVLASCGHSLPGLQCASLLADGEDTRSGKHHGPEIHWPEKVKVKVNAFKNQET